MLMMQFAKVTEEEEPFCETSSTETTIARLHGPCVRFLDSELVGGESLMDGSQSHYIGEETRTWSCSLSPVLPLFNIDRTARGHIRCCARCFEDTGRDGSGSLMMLVWSKLVSPRL